MYYLDQFILQGVFLQVILEYVLTKCANMDWPRVIWQDNYM